MKRLIIIVLTLINSVHCISQNTDYYNIAYSKIETMLKENNNSFKDAVFTVENAYFDNNLDVEAIYKKIARYADFCVGIKESGNIIYDGKGKDQDKALVQYSVFAFFTEKIPIFNEDKIDTVYPFKYNYEDFAGKNDWSNMFVTKLMQTKQGNCHSLPYLYKIIMDELGEKSYLSLCPNHLYIKVQNEKMGWHNIELTNSNFPTDAYLMSSGYIHIDAIRNGIYMKALTQQESIALCLIDLAQGYIAKFGVGNGEFVLKCCETALKYFPDCITAMLLELRILAEKYQNLEVKNDEQFAELTELTEKIHKLGYRKMPNRMYQNWLNRVQSEKEEKDFYGLKGANITASQANTKNPFADYGYDKSIMIRTASETVFEEFFDLEDTVELGNVYFNIRTNNITGFISAEKLKNEIAVDLIAISIDPKAEKYWWISPYAYCLNNPIKYIDPNGEEPMLYGLLCYYGTNKGGNSRLDQNMTIGAYNVTPFYDNNNNLIGYNAGRYVNNGQDYRTEYQMLPSDLSNFSKNVNTYEAAANLVYSSGEPNWSTVAMVDQMANGNIAGAFAELGNQWAGALQDPSFWLSVATSIAGMGSNLPKQLTPSQTKSINSLVKQIDSHQNKLAAYKKDPMKFDNNGYLKNAPNEAAKQKIIQGRIKHLENEIKTFQNNITKILNGE